jgi:hypothetical protein
MFKRCFLTGIDLHNHVIIGIHFYVFNMQIFVSYLYLLIIKLTHSKSVFERIKNYRGTEKTSLIYITQKHLLFCHIIFEIIFNIRYTIEIKIKASISGLHTYT